MRWTLGITLAICLALGAYVASPLIALHRIAAAIEARDAIALTERIDFKAVKKSFKKQFIATYRELTGKPVPLGAIASRFAGSVADPLVARLMTVAALLDLLGKGEAKTNGRSHASRPPFTAGAFDSVWRLWLNSDYLGRDFYIYLPPEARRSEQFRVHLRPDNWRWTVVGIGSRPSTPAP